jgi:acetoin utilization deacetylase AcuC-like enzyme
MILITSPRFEEHTTPPGHPEGPERARVFDEAALRWLNNGGAVRAPRPATTEELARVHAPEYLTALEGIRGRAVALDEDTFTSPESCDIALLAAGAAIDAAAHAIDRREPAFALVRPPGHHAERDRAMGFCLLNNVAAAAAASIARGLSRVAIVDIDVHHGNGTQWMFYDDPRVLYVSSHQFPFYPGTGAADEAGHGAGLGFTVNVPLEAGSTDEDYALVYREAVMPVLDAFAPEFVIVSAGFDAHERDPLASMRMTTNGYASIVRQLTAAAPGGAIAFVTEGGYDLGALASCLDASFAAIDGAGPDPSATAPGRPAHPAGAARGERALRAVRAAQAPYWRGI